MVKNLDIHNIQKLESGFTIVKDQSGKLLYPDENALEYANISSALKKLVIYDDNVYRDVSNNKYYLLKTYPFGEDKVKCEYLDVTSLQNKLNNSNNLINELQIDFTTKLPTKRKLFNDMAGYIANTQEPFGVIICDIDHFKKVNDDFGHNVGDQVLRALSQTLKDNLRNDNLRPTDIIGRFGGEEIVILVKNVDPQELKDTAERLRISVEKMKKPVTITISLGYVHSEDYSFDNVDNIQNVCAELIAMADQGLYYSKENGRNRSSGYSKERRK